MNDHHIERGHHLLIGIRPDGTMAVVRWWPDKPDFNTANEFVKSIREPEFKRYTVVENVGPMFDLIG